MTKKDFEMLADLIKARLDSENRCAHRAMVDYGINDRVTRDFRANAGGVQLLACDLIDQLIRDHPRFDAEIFANAAGLAHLIDVHPHWVRPRKRDLV